MRALSTFVGISRNRREVTEWAILDSNQIHKVAYGEGSYDDPTEAWRANGAKTGAVLPKQDALDDELAWLAAVWPNLPGATRDTVLNLVRDAAVTDPNAVG